MQIVIILISFQRRPTFQIIGEDVGSFTATKYSFKAAKVSAPDGRTRIRLNTNVLGEVHTMAGHATHYITYQPSNLLATII
jgi:hypothetical protein